VSRVRRWLDEGCTPSEAALRLTDYAIKMESGVCVCVCVRGLAIMICGRVKAALRLKQRCASLTTPSKWNQVCVCACVCVCARLGVAALCSKPCNVFQVGGEYSTVCETLSSPGLGWIRAYAILSSAASFSTKIKIKTQMGQQKQEQLAGLMTWL